MKSLSYYATNLLIIVGLTLTALVITALGLVADVERAPLTGLTAAGHDVWLVGPAAGQLGGSHLDDLLGADHGGPVPGPDPEAPGRHRQVHAAITAGVARSVHDLSEGGLAVAAAEWALGGRLGLRLLVDDVPAPTDEVALEVLFGEGPARYLIEADPADHDRLAALVPSARRIGLTTAETAVVIGASLAVSMDDIQAAFVHHRPAAPPPPERATSTRTCTSTSTSTSTSTGGNR